MDNSNPSQNVQNAFFNQARRDRTRVTVHLKDGRTMIGRIKGFDRFALILENQEGEQLIFKHAISTLSPERGFGNTIDVDSLTQARAERKHSSREDN
ncbi:MAG: RNA chaperone Hfq [Acidobacteria bacterium]|nr:RNA chaperone Hfq [Acidobacteriota bacterium]